MVTSGDVMMLYAEHSHAVEWVYNDDITPFMNLLDLVECISCESFFRGQESLFA